MPKRGDGDAIFGQLGFGGRLDATGRACDGDALNTGPASFAEASALRMAYVPA